MDEIDDQESLENFRFVEIKKEERSGMLFAKVVAKRSPMKPDEKNVRDHLMQLGTPRATVVYHLNGMNVDKPCWAHGEVHDGVVDLRMREVTSAEVSISNLMREKYPVRTWTDSTGSFSITARFVSYANGRVQIRTPRGRLIEVEKWKLSDADLEYLDSLWR